MYCFFNDGTEKSLLQCLKKLVLFTLYFYALSELFPRSGYVYWCQTFEAVLTGDCDVVKGAMLIGALKEGKSNLIPTKLISNFNKSLSEQLTSK